MIIPTFTILFATQKQVLAPDGVMSLNLFDSIIHILTIFSKSPLASSIILATFFGISLFIYLLFTDSYPKKESRAKHCLNI